MVVGVDVLSDGTGRVRLKETSGQGGYEPGTLIKNDARKLTAQEVQWFVDRMQESGFWELPKSDKQPENEIVLDGATWVVEGKNADQYQRRQESTLQSAATRCETSV